LTAALGAGCARSLWLQGHTYALAKGRASSENVFTPLVFVSLSPFLATHLPSCTASFAKPSLIGRYLSKILGQLMYRYKHLHFRFSADTCTSTFVTANIFPWYLLIHENFANEAVHNFPQVFPSTKLSSINHDSHLHLSGFSPLRKILTVDHYLRNQDFQQKILVRGLFLLSNAPFTPDSS